MGEKITLEETKGQFPFCRADGSLEGEVSFNVS